MVSLSPFSFSWSLPSFSWSLSSFSWSWPCFSWHTIILTSLVLLLCTWFIALLVVHIWFPFWAKQPILHTYDFWRRIYLARPLVLQTDAAALTQSQQRQMWFRPTEVQTWSLAEVPEPVLDTVLEALQGMGSTEMTLWAMPKRVWVGRMAGGSASSMLSLYTDRGGLTGGNVAAIKAASVAGVLLSRPVSLWLYSIKTPVYYFDTLATRGGGNAQTISCALFQTHEFRQRRRQGGASLWQGGASLWQGKDPIPVSIFKKEGAPVAGLVPVLQNRVVHVPAPRLPRLQLPVPYRVRHMADAADIYSLYGLFDTVLQPAYDLLMVPERASFQNRLDLGELVLYAVLNKDVWAGFYVFRRTWLLDAETGAEAVELAAAWHASNLPVGMFRLAFLAAVQDLSETVSLNRLIIPYRGLNARVMGEGTPIVEETVESWYLYNMISPGLTADRAFVFV